MQTLENSQDLHGQKSKKSQCTSKLYHFDRIIGHGLYSTVFEVTHITSGKSFALKRTLHYLSQPCKELSLLQSLSHPNIPTLHNFFYTRSLNPHELYTSLILDFIPESLSNLIKHYTSKKQPIPSLHIKLYAYQLLRAVGYLHNKEISHNDITPSNILINPESHSLKLCDFNSSTQLNSSEDCIPYKSSYFYTAPELLLGAKKFSCESDLWSVGCVIAEMVLGNPLFKGQSEVDQLVKIFKVLGTPDSVTIEEMNPDMSEFQFPKLTACPLEKIFEGKTSREGISLIEKLLVYMPKERVDPYEAILLPFFDDLKQDKTKLRGGKELPELFDWNDEEVKFASL